MLMRAPPLTPRQDTLSVLHMDPLGNYMTCVMPVLAHRGRATGEWSTVRPLGTFRFQNRQHSPPRSVFMWQVAAVTSRLAPLPPPPPPPSLLLKARVVRPRGTVMPVRTTADRGAHA